MTHVGWNCYKMKDPMTLYVSASSRIIRQQDEKREQQLVESCLRSAFLAKVEFKCFGASETW